MPKNRLLIILHSIFKIGRIDPQKYTSKIVSKLKKDYLYKSIYI